MCICYVSTFIKDLLIGAIAASGRYTEGLLTFGITDIHCNGTEQNISLCAQNEVLLHNCQTHDDAGAVCQGRGMNSLTVRLFSFNSITKLM